MGERYFSISFPEDLVKEPVLYSLVKRYGIEPNIYRASVSGNIGWMVLSLSGADEKIDEAMVDLRCRGALLQEGDKSFVDLKSAPVASSIRVRLRAPKEEAGKPFMNDMIKSHDVVVNIRQARVDPDEAVLEMEISGALESIDKAVEFLKSRDIEVDPIEGNVIE